MLTVLAFFCPICINGVGQNLLIFSYEHSFPSLLIITAVCEQLFHQIILTT